MQVIKLSEHGLHEALLGLSLSYNVELNIRIAHKLANQDGGHNVFLEQIQCWFDVDAPRYWWQQFDRYRIGTTRQSESTMHTLTKRYLTQDDFQGGIPDDWLDLLNAGIDKKQLDHVKQLLPESFLQRRVVTINYKSLRNIVRQRQTHRLKEWQVFCESVKQQIDYPEWL